MNPWTGKGTRAPNSPVGLSSCPCPSGPAPWALVTTPGRVLFQKSKKGASLAGLLVGVSMGQSKLAWAWK